MSLGAEQGWNFVPREIDECLEYRYVDSIHFRVVDERLSATTLNTTYSYEKVTLISVWPREDLLNPMLPREPLDLFFLRSSRPLLLGGCGQGG